MSKPRREYIHMVAYLLVCLEMADLKRKVRAEQLEEAEHPLDRKERKAPKIKIVKP